MFAYWNVAEETRATNRYDNFTRFAELAVHTNEKESWIQVSGQYQTGTRIFAVALSREDAERLRDALTAALNEKTLTTT